MTTTNTVNWTALAGLMLMLSTAGGPAAQEPKPEGAGARDAQALKDDKDKTSYAVGMNLGTAVRRQSADQATDTDLDVNLIVQGFKDAFAGGKTLLTDAEMRTILNKLQADLKSRQALNRSEKAARAKSDGDAFLAENKGKEGVVTLPSGLQYKILKTGDGKKPTIEDTVVCHYRGTLIDGTEFDSSYNRNAPATFALSRVIKGWTEALQLMPAGSKWQLVIPSDLAYGERGSGARVPPNATLIFEVELIAIVPSAAGKGAGIELSFKLDPRITKGLYMGDRWVQLPFSQVGPGKQVTVAARAAGAAPKGKPTDAGPNAGPKWIPADPEMVTVTPGEGNEVSIAVLRPGETSLRVVREELSREVVIKAAYKGDALHVEILQKPYPEPPGAVGGDARRNAGCSCRIVVQDG